MFAFLFLVCKKESHPAFSGLTQWFDTAPSRTCPQCRIQVSKRHIINKLFFDVALEEQTAPDAETLQNELDKVKAQLSMKEKEKRECQAVVDGLRDTLDVRNATIESLQKVLGETEMLCSSLKSLKKKIDILQDTLKVPSVTRETLSRLVFESPAPVELRHPKLHRPAHSDEINLDATFDVDTPEHQPCRPLFNPAKRQKLDKRPPPVVNLAKKVLKETVENWADDVEDDALKGLLPAFIRNSVLSKKPSSGSLLGPHKNTGTVRMGYDGLGGRTKFIQPVSFPAACVAVVVMLMAETEEQEQTPWGVLLPSQQKMS
ncbi:traf-interacting hypothetical protein [Limosa lapponica baueri]|uniref:E3 ubiquitin-protein ligase TRAIP n=1 Tax=Limosa lapponica baueri TaxID=1758121 RepID=A0A2I0TCR3_LIMLA|nr:traf-interacting hypothetical protein [Limosa lapponica baueri]